MNRRTIIFILTIAIIVTMVPTSAVAGSESATVVLRLLQKAKLIDGSKVENI